MDTHRVSIKQLGRLLVEMIKAILEFFTTGRLLKQVNTTILALIPKVRAPSTVSDFRPISCCNVLYKVITKIIVQRLRLVLDKLISPSQNAFVPGRSIGDNILLAQELFAGYNRQGLPMRCALKVDLRKAYDTVEWDFLSAVLQMFGFPGTFIGWVEECVTTPMFSVASMGTLTVSSRVPGVKTRGSDVPVLVRSDNGDDLLLFCKADVASVRVFRHGLAEFAKLSGLHANPQKSQLILSRSAQDVREQLLAALHFQEGHLPLRMGKHSVVLCGENSINQIGAHVTKCLLGNGLHITERGHQRGGKKDAYLLVERKLSSGISKGGMDVNNQSSIWVKWIAHTRLRHKSVWTVDVKGGSWGWRKILRLRSALLPYIEFKIGDGESFSLWHDPWHSLGSLITRFPRGPGRTNIPEAAKLSAVLVDGDWSWPPITDLECIEILHVLPIIHNGSDSILWRGGGFSTKAVYDIFRNHGPKCIRILKGTVRFTWPNRAWAVDIAWASKRWNGRHIVQAAYRALLAAIVYHIWQERKEEFFSKYAAELHYC
ncbi:UNVERIFIED_CONTAM: hypothetical protein Scaly_2831200 [Sesamum calycinum]|uniref:Reverse transcriptase domain-containing protein n=1 Tax=Sesamum calycinum TaxID=2727403 RepID=A0AAW2IU56_9LAMI